jgi:lysophospholipase L1-like esterase
LGDGLTGGVGDAAGRGWGRAAGERMVRASGGGPRLSNREGVSLAF